MPVPTITAAVRNRSPAPTPTPLAVYQPIFNRLGTIGIGEVAALANADKFLYRSRGWTWLGTKK